MMDGLWHMYLHASHAVRCWLGCKILGHAMSHWLDTLQGSWTRSCLYCGRTEEKTYLQAVADRNRGRMGP